MQLGYLSVDAGAGRVHVSAVAPRVHTRRLIIVVVRCILLHATSAADSASEQQGPSHVLGDQTPIQEMSAAQACM